MKIIVASDFVYKYVIEYMQTFHEYIPTQVSRLHEYPLHTCEEMLVVQKGTCLPDYVFSYGFQINLVNIEQLTNNNNKEMVQMEVRLLESRTGKVVKVYDYSATHISIFQTMNIFAIHHPYKGPLQEVKFLESLRSIPKTYQIGFVGDRSPRRQHILDELQKEGIQVLIVEEFGEERDRKLASCEYLLNVCWSEDYLIFNALRCVRWLEGGHKVISELSIDIPEHPNLIVSSYDNLIHNIKSILQARN
jgi:hypothetical protein